MGSAIAMGLAAAAIIMATIGQIFFGHLRAGVAFAFFAIAAAAVTIPVWLVIRVLKPVPAVVLWVALGSLPAVTLPFVFAGIKAAVIVGLSIILVASVVGGAAWYGARSLLAASGGDSRARGVGALVAALCMLWWACQWLHSPGYAVRVQPDASTLRLDRVPAPLTEQNPTTLGSYAVRTLSYGSGKDTRHPEYGARAQLITAPVDGRPFLASWIGMRGALRSRYWEVQPESLPLNGIAYLPAAQGKLPLILIVHGNYMMQGRSDLALSYLASFLASHGYIAVTIDENFLNSAWYNTFGESPETVARGWLLLEHLRQLHEWNNAPGNPLFGRIDTDRIALIGHSRGGEAVVVAAALNRLQRYPEDARRQLHYGYQIKSIVAIAPVFGQYRPTGRAIVLRDADYMVLHGAYDGDIVSFFGSWQFNQFDLSGSDQRFETAVYIYGANHSDFTSEWAGTEKPGPSRYLFNRKLLLTPEDQRRVVEAYVLSFIKVSASNDRRYLPLLRDARVGRNWLPKTIYLTQYRQSRTKWLANFEEDFDVTTGSLPGSHLSGQSLAEWSEREVQMRRGPNGNHAVFLGWESSAASYTIDSQYAIPMERQDSITLSIAALPDPGSVGPIDFTLELADGAGRKSSVLLSDFSFVQPPLPADYMKSELLSSVSRSEPVFQTFDFPLAWFEEHNDQLNLTDIRRIRLVFDRTPRGRIAVDDIGVQAGG